MTGGLFDRAVVPAVIVANGAVTAWGAVDSVHCELAERFESVCLLFFVAELVMRLRRQRWRVGAFLRQPWAAFDAAVILAALLPPLGSGVLALRLARLGRLARVAHLGRNSVHLGHHVGAARLLRLRGDAAVMVVGVVLAVAAAFAGMTLLGVNPWA